MKLEESSEHLSVCPWRFAVLLLGFASEVPLRTVGDGSLHSAEQISDLR